MNQCYQVFWERIDIIPLISKIVIGFITELLTITKGYHSYEFHLRHVKFQIDNKLKLIG